MASDHLLDLPLERREIELRRARERDAAAAAFDRRRRVVMWQCVALAFLGVPIYAASWGLSDPRTTQLLMALGLCVSYAGPFFRWLAYHVRSSEEFGG
jgi:hypothetical protein